MTSSGKVMPFPQFAAASRSRKAQPQQSAPAQPAFSGHSDSSSATDVLRLRDALIGRQPRFGGDHLIVQPTVIPTRPYTVTGPDGRDKTRPTPSAAYLPSIIEESEDGSSYAIDPISLALHSNTYYFYEDFNPDSALALTATLDYLKNKILKEREEERGISRAESRTFTPDDPRFDPDKDVVTIEINSPGGYIVSLNNIADTIDSLKNNGIVVSTVTQGLAASCGSLLAALGTPGWRKMTKRSRVMIHQPLSSAPYGQATDHDISNKSLQQTKKDVTWALYSASSKSDFGDIPADQQEAYKAFIDKLDIEDIIKHDVDASYAGFARTQGIDYDPDGKLTFMDFTDGTERDNWLNADKSINHWGLVDEIVDT